MINRNFFFSQVRLTLFGGHLLNKQVAGLTTILDEWDANHAAEDDRWLAYMFATAHHETDRTMQPIQEYGKGRGRPYGVPDPQTGQAYYGRGFVQLTWKANYQSMGNTLHHDLVNHPELALDLQVATQILFYGMMHGSFTGKRLSDYFSPAVEDWENARRIINGKDKATLVADYGKKYYAAISHTV